MTSAVNLPRSTSPAVVKAWAFRMGARCDLCPNKDKIAVGPSPLPERHRLTLVGQEPGRNEEKLGQPFVGLSGKLVTDLLLKNKLRRGETYLTNSALCRSESERENAKAAECCAPRLYRELAQTSPAPPIMALGSTATRSLLNIKTIFLARGFIFKAPSIEGLDVAQKHVWKRPVGPSREKAALKLETFKGRNSLAGRIIMPSLHPSFVLRTQTWSPIIRIDFRRASRWIRGEVSLNRLADLGRHVVTESVLPLYALERVISLDVETTHAKSALLARLLCVGVSDGDQTFVLWPWAPKMAKPLARFLKSRLQVVAHNFTFDRTVLEMHGVL